MPKAHKPPLALGTAAVDWLYKMADVIPHLPLKLEMKRRRQYEKIKNMCRSFSTLSVY